MKRFPILMLLAVTAIAGLMLIGCSQAELEKHAQDNPTKITAAATQAVESASGTIDKAAEATKGVLEQAKPVADAGAAVGVPYAAEVSYVLNVLLGGIVLWQKRRAGVPPNPK